MTAIEWTDKTWNPVTGCTKVSQGCKHCYAESIVKRFGGDFTKVRWHEGRLNQPKQWGRPQRIFVNSMSDMFHEDIPDEFIERVLLTIKNTPEHDYQILTKRPLRMERFMAEHYMAGADFLDNLWLGVSVENRETANRIALLRMTEAAVKFISFEPLLEDMKEVCLEGIDWAIVGGESGYPSRKMETDWARRILQQCRKFGTAFFMKQMGTKGDVLPVYSVNDSDTKMRRTRKGNDLREIPEDLRIREMPTQYLDKIFMSKQIIEQTPEPTNQQETML